MLFWLTCKYQDPLEILLKWCIWRVHQLQKWNEDYSGPCSISHSKFHYCCYFCYCYPTWLFHKEAYSYYSSEVIVSDIQIIEMCKIFLFIHYKAQNIVKPFAILVDCYKGFLYCISGSMCCCPLPCIISYSVRQTKLIFDMDGH